MDVCFNSRYKSHSNILQLQISILKCRIMRPEVKLLNNTKDELFLQPKFRLPFHNEIILPSNPPGSNKNTHLQNQQKLDSSSVFLRNTGRITTYLLQAKRDFKWRLQNCFILT